MKQPILCRNNQRKKESLGKLVIGVAGLTKGVGTTHTSLLFAKYCCRWLRKDTIYMECNQDEIKYIQEKHPFNRDWEERFTGEELVKEDSYFLYHGIRMFPNIHEKQMGSILGEEYECAIIDFGYLTPRCLKEYERCHIKIIVSSSAPWKIHLLKEIPIYDNSFLCIPFLSSKELRQFNKTLSIPVYSIPHVPNPFKLSAEITVPLQKILNN